MERSPVEENPHGRGDPWYYPALRDRLRTAVGISTCQCTHVIGHQLLLTAVSPCLLEKYTKKTRWGRQRNPRPYSEKVSERDMIVPILEITDRSLAISSVKLRSSRSGKARDLGRLLLDRCSCH